MPSSPPPPAQLELTTARATASPAPGMRARMPAMINRLMPLPMPYSSICSPSHIRKTVPAVIVSTAVNCQLEEDAHAVGSRQTSRTTRLRHDQTSRRTSSGRGRAPRWRSGCIR